MSEVSPESALALRQGILGHDTWNESQPELSGFTRLGFIAIDGGRVAPGQLPAEVRTRLGILDPSAPDGSRYELVLGRRHDRHYEMFGDMQADWPEGRQWDPSFVYDDHGIDAAFVRISRADKDVLLSADYLVSAQESFEPGQPPLCDVRVELEDHMPLRQRIVALGESGGSMLELATALGIDPKTGKRDPDKPHIDSETDMWAGTAKAMGVPMSEPEIEHMRSEEAARAEMRVAEEELQPLTTAEVLGLAALVRQVETFGQC